MSKTNELKDVHLIMIKAALMQVLSDRGRFDAISDSFEEDSSMNPLDLKASEDKLDYLKIKAAIMEAFHDRDVCVG